MYDYYLNLPAFADAYNVQQTVGVLTEGLILLALDNAHASVQYKPGQVLALDDGGFPVPAAGGTDFEPSAVIGKLIMVVDATDPKLAWTGGYELVAPASGLNLPGIENGGLLDGIDEVTKKGLLIKLGF